VTAPAARDSSRPLAGKRVAVIVEHKFIPEEFAAYRFGLELLGAELQLLSRTEYGDFHDAAPAFWSDVDPTEDEPWQTPQKIFSSDIVDFSDVQPSDFDAIIVAANYVSVRLRWSDTVPPNLDPRAYVQAAPAHQFVAQAMADPSIVKGALCHGLWLFTPTPELLAGRRVTCHTVVMADVLNCGAQIAFEHTPNGSPQAAPVVIDRDLVTGFSKHEVVPFIAAIAQQLT
jgi:protease I